MKQEKQCGELVVSKYLLRILALFQIRERQMVIAYLTSNNEIYSIIAAIHLSRYLLSRKSLNCYNHPKRLSNLSKVLELTGE